MERHSDTESKLRVTKGERGCELGGQGWHTHCAVCAHSGVPDAATRGLQPARLLVQWILQARTLEWAPCPPPGDLPDPGAEPRSPALQAGPLSAEPQGNPCTHFYMKQIINRDLLHGAGNPTPYSVIACMGKDPEEEQTCVRVTESVCCTPETGTALWPSYSGSEKREGLRPAWLCDPWTAARQAPPSMGFSRQEHWSGQPCPPPGDLPNPGAEPRSPALQAEALTSELWTRLQYKKRLFEFFKNQFLFNQNEQELLLHSTVTFRTQLSWRGNLHDSVLVSYTETAFYFSNQS